MGTRYPARGSRRNVMMTETAKRAFFKDRKDWRSWLQKHYASETELWLMLYKKHTNMPCVSLAEAVEEALCFGWIDGKLRRIDEEKHQVRFTPRKKGSTWSEVNIGRVKRLIKEGRMTEIGIAKFKDGMKDPRNKLLKKDFEIPKDILVELKRDMKGWEAFDGMATSYKRQYVWWIASAKREETRRKRIEETLRRCRTGKHTWWDDRAAKKA